MVKDLSDAGIPGMQVVQVTTNTLDAAMEAYKNSPDVLYVEPDYKISLSPIEKTGKVADVDTMSINSAAYPNDPGYQYLWGLHRTGQAPCYEWPIPISTDPEVVASPPGLSHALENIPLLPH